MTFGTSIRTVNVKTLFVLLGPTGVGKTELSLQIAEFLHIPILNADSRQLYKDLPIGTAAPTAEEQARVRHYFVGTLDLTDYYSAARYEAEALAVLNTQFAERDVALLSGGSMLYIDAVCQGIDDMPSVDAETRASVLQRLEERGLDALSAELKLLDPDYYAQCDIRNTKRVVHALEICYMTGRSYSSFRIRATKERPFRIIKIGLTRDREELYDRINRRVDLMMDHGLLDEARRVYPYRHLNALNTVGYKELFRHFDGEWTLDFALDKVRRNSRVYSRKQMTWFRRDPSIQWFSPDKAEEIRNFITKQISAKA